MWFNMDNEILQIILQNTFTTLALKHRLRALKNHLEKGLYGAQTNQPSPQDADIQYLATLPKDFFVQFTKDNLSSTFAKIEDEINKLPVLTIYLPFETDDVINLQIGSFARRAFGKIIILETKYDPRLIAGCAFSSNGIYKDYSLKARIEERKAEILDSFKRFLR